MKNILCYGDSNTHGYIPNEGGRYPREIRWPGRLQKMFGDEAYIIEEALNGRTTVWEDPIEGFKSGKSYLIPCLNSHKPIDVFVLMLGTNDLKSRFSLTAFEISKGCETLIKMVKAETPFSQGYVPEILLVSPIHMSAGIDNHRFGGQFLGESCEKRSREFAKYYRAIAEAQNCHFMDAAEFATASEKDFLHMDEKGHEAFANAIYAKLQEILNK